MNEKTIKAQASLECVQDMEAYFSMIRGLARNPITDEEIKQWKVIDEQADEHYVKGAKIQTKDFTEQELASYNRIYDRHPAGMIIRTPDPTEGEIKDWQNWHEKINNMNLDEIRKKVQFWSDEEPPYQGYYESDQDIFEAQWGKK